MARVREYKYEGRWVRAKELAHLIGKHTNSARHIGNRSLPVRTVVPAWLARKS